MEILSLIWPSYQKSTVEGHGKGFGIEENPEWILGLMLGIFNHKWPLETNKLLIETLIEKVAPLCADQNTIKQKDAKPKTALRTSGMQTGIWSKSGVIKCCKKRKITLHPNECCNISFHMNLLYKLFHSVIDQIISR